MALAKGTNCGFVTVAPSADPDGAGTGQVDNLSAGGKFIAPADAIAITEIGWYCPVSTQEANFQVGLYDHDGVNNEPEARLVSGNAAKGTGAGWKKVAVDLAITGGTTYWICAQCDDTVTTTTTDYTDTVGERLVYKTDGGAATDLINPWGASSGSSARLLAIYAVYVAAGGGATLSVEQVASAIHLDWTMPGD